MKETSTYQGPRLARVRPEDVTIPRDSNFLPRALTHKELAEEDMQNEARLAREAIRLASGDPNCSLRAIADSLNKSERTVQRILEKSGSRGFRAELHHARMQEAERLLRGSDTVQNIASQVGFRGAMHFAKAFRRYSGQSPTEYRRSVTQSAQ